MRRGVRALLIVAVSSCLVLASEKPDQDAVVAKLSEAAAKTNIFELTAFRMKADIRLDVGGAEAQGTYLLLWNGPSQWREEIELSKYKEIQVGGKGLIWVQRSTPFIPTAIVNLTNALGFGTNNGSSEALIRFALRDGEVVTKQQKAKARSHALTCFEIADQKAKFVYSCLTSPCGDFDVDEPKRTACVDESTGLIYRLSVEDNDFQNIGDKIFPHKLRFLSPGRSATISISELTSGVTFTPDTFAPLSGIAAEPGCMNPVPPRITMQVAPEYPQMLRAARVQGPVYLDAVIDTDGHITAKRVLKSPNPLFSESAIKAMKKWTYAPAICDGQPVPFHTVHEFDFVLSSTRWERLH
jgi:TonB family protein